MEIDDEIFVFIKKNKIFQDKFFVSNNEKLKQKLKKQTLGTEIDIKINQNLKLKEKLENYQPKNIIASKVNYDKFFERNRNKKLKQEIQKRRLQNFELYKVAYQQPWEQFQHLDILDIKDNQWEFVNSNYEPEEKDIDGQSFDSNHAEHKNNDYPSSPDESSVEDSDSLSSCSDLLKDEDKLDIGQDIEQQQYLGKLFKQMSLNEHNKNTDDDVVYIPTIKEQYFFHTLK